MRLWSLHPKFLDSQGLIALWREGLLAKKVLEGKTKGYRHHPQLIRFRRENDSVDCIHLYLHLVCDEADRRGYNFDRSKLNHRTNAKTKINVTRGQMQYEWQHLLQKLKARSPEIYLLHCKRTRPVAHPLFQIVTGEIEEWEIIGK